MTDKKKIKILIVISLILVFLFVFWGLKSTNWKYFLSTRLPKVLAIVITGASISISTLIFQTISNNRILTPSTLGLDSLYLLIQSAIVFILGSSSVFIVNKNLNFVLSVVLMMVFSRLLFKNLFKKESNNIMMLLLIGMIFGTLFKSLTSFFQMMIDPNEFLHIQDKMFASFNNINTDILTISIVVIVLAILYLAKHFKALDVSSLGRDNAISLGVDYEKLIKRMLLIVSILVSVSTALVGPITFLGLLVVNLAREFLNTFEHRYLAVASTLLSLVFLLGGQLLLERVFNFATPISVIINLVGGVYFIHLLLKENIS